jgi:AP-3 complex subunit delta-1
MRSQADRQNLQAIVRRLSTHLRPVANAPSAASALQRAQQSVATGIPSAPATPIFSAAYRASVISLILRMCSSATYSNVTNFAWLIDTLVELTYVARTLGTDSATTGMPSLGAQLRDTLIDVVARVRQIRPYAAKKMSALLQDEDLLDEGEASDAAEVLGAAAWICGEYCRWVLTVFLLPYPSSADSGLISDLEDPRPIIASLFGSSTTSTLPPRILALYIHNGVKITASWLGALYESWDESAVEQIRSITAALESQLAQCAKSPDAELQERAAELGGLLQLVRQGLDLPRALVDTDPEQNGEDADGSGGGFASSSRQPPGSLKLLEPLFFSHELNPVNPKAQSLVAPPERLDLDAALNPTAWAAFDDETVTADEVDDYGRPIRRHIATDRDDGSIKAKKKGTKSGTKKSRKRADLAGDGHSPQVRLTPSRS